MEAPDGDNQLIVVGELASYLLHPVYNVCYDVHVSFCLCVCVFVDAFSCQQHCSYSGGWCFGVGSSGVCGLVQEKEEM